MKKGVVLLTGLMLIDLPALAENGVFKCTGADGEIVYQGTSCKAQQQQVTLIEPRKREPEPMAAEAMKPAGDPSESGSKRPLVAADELVVGMSDTKVLNMRGWGRPRNIARSRGEDGWREEWTYGSADGVMRLVQFVNGKVAAVKSPDAQQVAAQQVTRATSTRIESQQIVAASASVSAQSAEQRSREAPAIADSLMRDSTGSNQRRERTWQPGIAESAAPAKSHGNSERTPKSQPEPRRVDGVASAPSVQDAPRRADARPAAPEASEQPQVPSASDNWHIVRTAPPSGSQALGLQPQMQASMQSSADRQLVRGEDTTSQ